MELQNFVASIVPSADKKPPIRNIVYAVIVLFVVATVMLAKLIYDLVQDDSFIENIGKSVAKHLQKLNEQGPNSSA